MTTQLSSSFDPLMTLQHWVTGIGLQEKQVRSAWTRSLLDAVMLDASLTWIDAIRGLAPGGSNPPLFPSGTRNSCGPRLDQLRLTVSSYNLIISIYAIMKIPRG